MYRVVWDNGKFTIRAKVYPFFDSDNLVIYAERSHDLGTMSWDEGPRVSWPTCAPLPLDEARQFAEALAEAVRIGESISGPVSMFRVTLPPTELRPTPWVEEMAANNIEQVRSTLEDLASTAKIELQPGA